MVDTAFFLQDDWKINRFLTFSAGLRWENQTQVSDNKDIGPRVAIAYALDGHKKGKTSKTVVRLGFSHSRNVGSKALVISLMWLAVHFVPKASFIPAATDRVEAPFSQKFIPR